MGTPVEILVIGISSVKITCNKYCTCDLIKSAAGSIPALVSMIAWFNSKQARGNLVVQPKATKVVLVDVRRTSTNCKCS